jgi:hypothetical protein
VPGTSTLASLACLSVTKKRSFLKHCDQLALFENLLLQQLVVFMSDPPLLVVVVLKISEPIFTFQVGPVVARRAITKFLMI